LFSQQATVYQGLGGRRPIRDPLGAIIRREMCAGFGRKEGRSE